MSAAPQLVLAYPEEPARPLTLAERFDQWMADNPHVWPLFERFTFAVIHAGHAHYSADAICHRMRWHTSVETRGDDLKVNNDYVSRLARRFHQQHPQHAGFFRLRELKTQ